MEVILIKDVDNVGIKNEVVKVKNGFARNYLLKQKLAIIATPGNRQNLQRQIKQAQELRAKRLSEARLLAERLSKLSLKITKKAGKEGRLYGSVTSAEVAELLQSISGETIDKRKLILPHQLKAVGNYAIQLKLETGVVAEIKLEVLGEEEAEKKSEPRDDRGEESSKANAQAVAENAGEPAAEADGQADAPRV